MAGELLLCRCYAKANDHGELSTTDGQDANSTGLAQQFIGGMAAYVFAVTAVPTVTSPHRGCDGRWCWL